MKQGDFVLFHPYFKPERWGPGGYPAKVVRVHPSGKAVAVEVTLPDGGPVSVLPAVAIASWGTNEPGTVTPAAAPPKRKPARPKREKAIAHAAAPELVVTIPKAKKSKPAEPDLKPHWNGEIHACPMCMRKHRGDGPYCSERCEARAVKPPDLVFGVRRSLYFDPSSPKGKGSLARPGNA